MEDVLNIPGSIHSISQEGNAVYADEVFDKRKNKKQQLVNQETDEALEAQNQHIGTLEEAVGEGGSVDERIAQAKSETESDIKGGASEEYDTLKKAEDAIKAEVNAREGAVSDEASARQDAINTAKTEIIGGASADCNTLGKAEIKISTNAQDIAQLQAAYEALTESDVVVVAPTDTWPVANPQQNTIYRVVDRVNPTPQYYEDYMYNGTAMVLMARYNNAIDPRPKKGSQNLVSSGGVFDNMGALDVSELNATENPHTLATYADLSAALATIPSDYQKGGMSIKFVQSSDNKYVQYRLMSPTWSTVINDWQGVDDEPTIGSDNLVKSGGVAGSVNGYVLKRIAINGIYTELVFPNISEYPYDSIVLEIDLSTNITYLYIDLSTTPSQSGITQHIFEGVIQAGKHKFVVPYNNEQYLRIWAPYDTPAYPQNSFYSIMAPSVVPDMYMDVTQLKNRTTTAEGNIEELNETVENIELYLHTTDIKNSIPLQNGYIDNNGVIKSDASWKYGVYLLKAGLTLTIDSKAAGVGYPTLGIASGATVNVGDSVTLVQGTSYSANEDTYLVINATDIFRHAYLKTSDNLLSDYADDVPTTGSNNWVKSGKIKQLLDNFKVGISIVPAPNINTTDRTLEFTDADSMLYIGNKSYELPNSISLDGVTSSWGMLYYDIDNQQVKFNSYTYFSYAMGSGNNVLLGMLVKQYDSGGQFKGFQYALLPFAYKVNGKFAWEAGLEDLQQGKNGTGILENNKFSYFQNLFQQANWASRNGGNTPHTAPLVMLWFSDIHGSSYNYNRLITFKNKFSSYVQSYLCTGDLVNDRYQDDFTYFTANDIMLAIGNHDVQDATTGEHSHVGTDAYNKYFAPFINNWGVVQPANAATLGLCYYYKDYTQKNIRLIVLDKLGWDSDQNTWLQGVLTDAKNNGLAVICANHYPASNTTLNRNNSFCSLYDASEIGGMPADAITSIQSWIDNENGEFICHLSGHTHLDYMGVIANTTQLSLTIDCAYCNYHEWNDSDRVVGEKSADCFNILSFDTYDKTIKLFRVGVDRDRWLRHKGTMCVKYDTRELLWND